MRRARIIADILLAAIALLGLAVWMWPTATPKHLRCVVMGYDYRSEGIVAKVAVEVPAGSWGQTQIGVQTAQGSCVLNSELVLWNRLPGETAKAQIPLPREAKRWHLIVCVTLPTRRQQLDEEIQGGAWEPIRPLWRSVRQHVPDTPGRIVQFGSDPFDVPAIVQNPRSP